ncbi:MAG: nitrilase-related carbon-nitrogen hydrolase [Thermoanaerobaculia bacterium]
MTTSDAGSASLREHQSTSGNPARWRWLFVAALLLPFSNMGTTIPIVAWLAPATLLRFLRVNRTRWAFAAAFIAIVLATACQFRGMIPAPPLLLPAIVGFYALVFFVPFFLDSWIEPRLDRFGALFVFPAAWTVCDYALAKFAPYGTWGSIAYTQYGNLPLLQIVSVSGIYGVTFLIAAFASVSNHVIERAFVWSEIKTAVLAFAALLCGVLLFGGIRLNFLRVDAPTVRIASLTSRDLDISPDAKVKTRLMHGGQVTEAETATIRTRQRVVNDDLLLRAEREAAAGAKIVFWGETNSSVVKSDEEQLLRQASELARRRGIYLLLGLGTLSPGQKKVLENKAVLIDPEGTVAWQFLKARPLPGQEAAISAGSDERLKVTPTPYGRLSAAICFDLDFPDLLRQAGAAHTDVLLAPSNDWRAIDPWHSQMAVFRAIEGGFNLVRHTSNGLSLAVDYQGRALGAMDHFRTNERVLVSEVPTRGVRTIYTRLGDWFPLLWIPALFWLIARAFLTRRRTAG